MIKKIRTRYQRQLRQLLPKWSAYRGFSLYRRTEDFVQWLTLEISESGELGVPAFGLQPIALQFPYMALSIGGRVIRPGGGDFWFNENDWSVHSQEILNAILREAKPALTEDLDSEKILATISPVVHQNQFNLASYGVALVLFGDQERGRHHLEQAAAIYGASTLEWSLKTAVRIRQWLSVSAEDIFAVLRREATLGAEILKI